MILRLNSLILLSTIVSRSELVRRRGWRHIVRLTILTAVDAAQSQSLQTGEVRLCVITEAVFVDSNHVL